MKLRRLLVLALVLSAIVGGVLGWAYWRWVVVDPGPHLDRDYVFGVVAEESPVFYRDGVTRVGVFFEDEHRAFVPWERIPRAYAAAIVAAEDDAFWSHPGIDAVHVLRAVLDNLRAGAVVSGGSTLTQQTAKNLYYRPDRSLRAKLIEALDALRLERHFSKTDILTLYANQFHVSGNGRGLGIAARHFFDKEVDQLTVLESAFLAGLVKAPSRYDPFLGDEEARARAVERAELRTRYVLQRLLAEPAEKLAGPRPRSRAEEQAFAERVAEVRAVQEEARRLLAEGFELPFKRGVFRYDSNAVLDEVARRLSEPPFAEVLATAGITDPKTAGLKVITTLDPVAQRAAVYGLWHHLTELGAQLEGFGIDAFVLKDAPGPRYDPDHAPRPGEFRQARVGEVTGAAGKKVVSLDLGGNACLLDRDALARAATAIKRGKDGSSSARASTKETDALADALPTGGVVWVSVREVTAAGAVCDLEARPELQGAAVVIRDGQVLAMVGGNDNRNFNRATALRQMGSTWKPLVYHAAIELGWSPDDVLDNRRQVFPFSTTFYWPSPDHEAPAEVSLAWAGAKSENVASVWLLHHLLDRLDDDAVAELATAFDLARREGESAEDYRLRIQRAGVLPTPSRVREAIFLGARNEVLAAIDQTAHPEDELALRSLLYGWGHEAEARRATAAWQQAALKHAWLFVEAERARCGEAYRRVIPALERGEEPGAIGDLWFRRTGDVLEVACGAAPEGFVAWDPSLAAPAGFFSPRPSFLDEPHLRIGRLHAATIDAVASAMERRTLELQLDASTDLYDPRVLYRLQDFRVLLALRYVTRMAERYGVRTDLQEVLSLPLGASEVTLEELTMVYEGLVTGRSWVFPGRAVGPDGARVVGEPLASTLLILEIRDVDDRVLYRAEPAPVDVARPETAAMTADVLRLVVTHGTGRRADGVVEIGGAAVPIGGKTGTTNDYRNAAFVGMLPVVHGEHAGGEIVVGVYTGYDDNRPMRRGGTRVGGANGALPAWIHIARGLAAGGLLGNPDARPPADGWRPTDPATLVRRPIDTERGLAAVGEGLPTVLTRPAPVRPSPEADLAPLETRPRRVRVAPRTVDAESGGRDRPFNIWSRLFGGPRAEAEPTEGEGRRTRERRRARAEDSETIPEVVPGPAVDDEVVP